LLVEAIAEDPVTISQKIPRCGFPRKCFAAEGGETGVNDEAGGAGFAGVKSCGEFGVSLAEVAGAWRGHHLQPFARVP
jgi:hypothetical protein